MEQSIWFEAQTGRIDNQDWQSNFYHYELPATSRKTIEAMIADLPLCNAGLDWTGRGGELKAIMAQSDRWKRRNVGLNRW